MPEGRLVIGSRRYSSWSLRGWLAVRLAGLAVEEVVIPVSGTGATPAIRAASPSGLVPYLEHRGHAIWESLAIAEYCAEIEPALWPEDSIARAHARAISAEMHAGFRALRQSMPMNLGRHAPGFGQNDEVRADIARIEAIWGETRARFGAGGAFLFGEHFTIADAMYAPVVARFLSYEPPLGPASRAYAAAIRAYPLIAAWYEAAAAEPVAWRIAKYEADPA
jgi:glutathione S-transferase